MAVCVAWSAVPCPAEAAHAPCPVEAADVVMAKVAEGWSMPAIALMARAGMAADVVSWWMSMANPRAAR